MNGDGLARFGDTIESIDGEEVGRLQPNNQWRIDEWDPTPEGEHMTTDTTRKELARHLPDEWEIVEWEPWGPEKTNHGGAIAYRVHVEHIDGTVIRLRPEATNHTQSRSHRVYNSHKLKKVLPDNSREKLLSAEMMSRLSHPAAVFNALVVAAESHTARPSLSAFCADEGSEEAASEC